MIKFIRYIVNSVLLFGVFTSASKASAQTNKVADVRIEPTMGTFVVRHSKVQEVLPFHGLRISKSLHSFRPELTVFHSRSKGILYYNYLLSFMNTLELEGLEPFWYLGINLSEFERQSPAIRAYPKSRVAGGHFGFGTYYSIGKYFAFRADVVIFRWPGKAVYAGGGFSIKIPLGESSDTGASPAGK